MTAASSNLAEAYGEPIDFTHSLFAHLEPSLRKHPHLPAVVCPQQQPDHLKQLVSGSDSGAQPSSSAPSPQQNICLEWSYSQLHHAAYRVGAALHSRGVKTGSAIATLLPNGVEWATLLWMQKLLKVTYSVWDSNALNAPREEELRFLLETIKPDAVFVINEAGAKAVDRALQRLDWSPHLKIVFGPTPGVPGWEGVLDLVESTPATAISKEQMEREALTDDDDRIDLVIFTSGTSTGVPKGCPRPVLATIHAMYMQMWGRHYESDGSMRSMIQTANFRIIAPAFAMGTWSRSGAIILPGGPFSPESMFEIVERHKPTVLVWVPALLHIVVGHPSFKESDWSSVDSILLGGDMIVKNAYLKAVGNFPRAHVQVGHGMTEGGSIFDWPFSGAGWRDIPLFGEICTIGTLNAGAAIKVADGENRPVKVGEVGELQFCCDSFIRHYVGDVQSHLFYKDEEGRQWFKTGDTGMVDQEGFYYILGRTKDIIKRSGVSITPAALESCVDTFTGSQTSVVAVPHPVHGQEALAVLGSLNGKTEDQIMQQVVDMFGGDYAICGAVTLEQLGLQDFPVNATGKIVKREIEERAAKFMDRT